MGFHGPETTDYRVNCSIYEKLKIIGTLALLWLVTACFKTSWPQILWFVTYWVLWSPTHPVLCEDLLSLLSKVHVDVTLPFICTALISSHPLFLSFLTGLHLRISVHLQWHDLRAWQQSWHDISYSTNMLICILRKPVDALSVCYILSSTDIAPCLQCYSRLLYLEHRSKVIIIQVKTDHVTVMLQT